MRIITPSSWDFSTSTRDVYKSCEVEYTDGNTKSKIKYTFTDPNKTEGKVLKVKQEVKSQAEAEKLAKKSLREKNSEEVKGKLNCMGDTDLSAGLTIQVQDFGKFDGNYIIKQITHNVGGGYKCSLDIRRCLNGY